MKIDRSFYIQIMFSDIQNQLLQLILKSWHKPINKMDLQRDRNCSYWKEKSTSLITNSLQTTKLKTVMPLSKVEFLMSAEHLF